MKKLVVFLCAMFLVLSITGIASAVPKYVYDGGLGTWHDADKTWVDDTQLCWACSASNMLSWTGWIGGPTLSTEDQIFADFKSYWNDDAGHPYYGIEWWFTGVNEKQGAANWAQLTNLTHTGFYTQALFNANNYWTDAGDLINIISTYIDDDRGISIRVAGPGSHFLTVWGMDPDVQQLFLTDSDDNVNALQTYSYSLIGGKYYLSGSYSSWYIADVDGLDRNSGGIQPTPRIPEPSTLLLLGSGLVGIAVWRKKAKK